MNRSGRWCAGLLLAMTFASACAALDPNDRSERWWDASRADRIGFSDRAAAQCKSADCDSLQIRSCLNDTLRPPVPASIRSKSIAQVAAACMARFNGKR